MPAQNLTNGFYNLQNATSANDIYGFMVGVNDMTGQTLMFGILIVGIMIFTSQLLRKGTDTKDALLVGSFFGGLMSLLFLALNLVDLIYAIIPIIVFGILIAYFTVRGY